VTEARRFAWIPLCLALAAAEAGAQQVPALDPELRALAEQEAPAVLDTLRRLTAVDSGSGQAAGMAGMADIIEQFAKGLGAEVTRLAPANNVVGPNLVITFRGTGSRKLMLMAHMDTVYVAGTAAAKPFRVDGNRAIAPGIADDKGGIAVFLHAVKLLHTRGFRDYERVTMVFNSDEERGSAGSRDLIRAQAQAHDAVLSGEPTGPQEGIVLGTSGVGQLSARLRFAGAGGAGDVTSRPIEELADIVLRTQGAAAQVPGARMNWTVMRAQDPGSMHRLSATDHRFATMTFRIGGRGSHAGVSPQLGINAVTEAAAVIQRITQAAAQYPEVHLHWRTASGGLISNIIPDRGLVVAELAVPRSTDVELVTDALSARGTRASVPGAQIVAEVAEGLAPAEDGAGEAFATADQRVPDAAAFEQLGKVVRQQIGRQKFESSSITVQDGMGFPAYNATEEGRALAVLARDLYAQLGGKLELVPRTYGGTDAVWAAQSGRPVVEGMGLPGGNYHSSDEEYVLIDRIPRRLALVAEMIRALARR
jgi:acetylornithine deacetylase/succinyl-diaminopimelate desuccinylase-like protein